MKIRIGHLDYSILPMPPEMAKKNLIGYQNADVPALYILANQPPSEQVRTLFHELIHAMLHADNVKDKSFSEERICEVLESPLTRLFQDNKKLHSVIQAAYKGKPIV